MVRHDDDDVGRPEVQFIYLNQAYTSTTWHNVTVSKVQVDLIKNIYIW